MQSCLWRVLCGHAKPQKDWRRAEKYPPSAVRSVVRPTCGWRIEEEDGVSGSCAACAASPFSEASSTNAAEDMMRFGEDELVVGVVVAA